MVICQKTSSCCFLINPAPCMYDAKLRNGHEIVVVLHALLEK